MRASWTHPVRDLQELPATAWGVPEALEHAVDHVNDGGLPVGAGDGGHARIVAEKLQAKPYLGDHGNASYFCGPQHGAVGANAGARHHPVHAVEDFGTGAEDARHVQSGQGLTQTLVIACVGHDDVLAPFREHPRRRNARFSEPEYQRLHGLTRPRCRGRCSRGRSPPRRRRPGRSRTAPRPCSRPIPGTRSGGVSGPS